MMTTLETDAHPGRCAREQPKTTDAVQIRGVATTDHDLEAAASEAQQVMRRRRDL
jgi:hypothetical protein